jgi:hypothetical protein
MIAAGKPVSHRGAAHGDDQLDRRAGRRRERTRDRTVDVGPRTEAVGADEPADLAMRDDERLRERGLDRGRRGFGRQPAYFHPGDRDAVGDGGSVVAGGSATGGPPAGAAGSWASAMGTITAAARAAVTRQKSTLRRIRGPILARVRTIPCAARAPIPTGDGHPRRVRRGLATSSHSERSYL